MELWYTERQTDNMKISFRIRETLVREKTEFQDLAVVDTLEFGRMLILDNCVMTTVKDEFVYHEMIVHVPLLAHPNPRRVLIIGGGDGGTVREVVKHPEVEKVTMVEIDRRVVENAKKFLPELACELDNPRAEVLFEDGIEYIKNHKDEFDVIILDTTDPIGPAVGLFTAEFYGHCHAALKDGGLVVAQTESPFVLPELIVKVQDNMAQSFPIVQMYLANIPTYPAGLWSFSIGSKGTDPQTPRPLNFDTRYYTTDVHKAAFTLPRFAAELSYKVRKEKGLVK